MMDIRFDIKTMFFDSKAVLGAVDRATNAGC